MKTQSLSGADFATLVALARMAKGDLSERERDRVFGGFDSDYARALAAELVELRGGTRAARGARMSADLRLIRDYAGDRIED